MKLRKYFVKMNYLGITKYAKLCSIQLQKNYIHYDDYDNCFYGNIWANNREEAILILRKYILEYHEKK